jgi:hypothetical protein
MPYGSEQSKESGIYKSDCCGHRILITGEVAFPNCPDHPQQRTKWELDAAVPALAEPTAYFWHSLDDTRNRGFR